MADWNTMFIGQKIKHIRESKGLSQGKLAKISGIAQSSISYIESGSKKPNIETIMILAKALDTPISSLIDNQQVNETLPANLVELMKYASMLDETRVELLTKLAKGLLNNSAQL